MSNQVQVVQTTREVEFVPYGSADKIKLNISIVKNLICVPTKSGKTCSDNDAIKFIMMCHAKRLDPFSGDAYLTGYDTQNGPQFSLITAHQAYLKRAEIHPEYDGMKSGVIIKNPDGTFRDVEGDFHEKGDNVVGGWATVYYKNRTHPCTRRIRMERFNKGFAQWAVDPAGQICKCAEADALRSSFPTMIGGLYMREEIDAGNFGMSVEVSDNARTPRLKPNLELSLQPEPKDLPAPASVLAAPEPFAGNDDDLTMTKPVEVVQQAQQRRAPKPAPSAQAAVDAAVAERGPTPQDSLDTFLTNAGVGWDDFRDFLVADGHYKGAHGCLTIKDLPTSICLAIIQNTPAMARAVKLYGKK